MLVSTLMTGITTNPVYTGAAVNDEFVLAIDMDPTNAVPTTVAAYGVVGLFVEGVDAQLNPQLSEKTYIRMGPTTTKTGNQRTFKIAGDRYIGDAAQDYMLSHAVKYGIGKAVVTKYVYYNMITGLGESGEIAIVVNSDGGGNGGENSAIDIELKTCGGKPSAYTYVPASINAVALSTVVPADGATAIARASSLVLTFNNAIARSAVSLLNATSGDVVACTQAWDATKKILTITPSATLAATTKYIVSVAGVVDVYGQALASSGTDFTTAA